MRVILDTQEIKFSEYIGELRSNVSRSNNVFDAKAGNQDGVQADIQGFKAEYAFAKKNNLFPDLGLSPRSGSYDGITRDNNRYDIKSTTYKNGNLLATLKINNDVDIYILAHVDDNEVNFIGWVRKEEFIKDENIRDLGHGPAYFLSRHKLNKF